MKIERNLSGMTAEELAMFLDKLKENDGYCPCSLLKTPETKCMCKNFRDIEEGICHCGLYKKTK